jgi:RNA polymerase sigma-70 factor (ECF subfamily)
MGESQRHLRLEKVFDDHAAAVRAYARRRTDPASADDAVGEVFAIAWRRLDDLPDEPLGWLFGCARRVLAHQQRRARRDNALTARLSSGLGEPPPVGDQRLADALMSLTESDRETLLLTAWEGLSPTEAAAALGCSRNAYTVRLHRARRRLAAALNREEHQRSDPIQRSRPEVDR